MARDRRVKDVAAAISGRRKTGRSAVYRWLWDNYGKIAGAKTGRSDWIAVVDTLRAVGIGANPGEELKPENVRKVWSRVVSDMKAQAARLQQKQDHPKEPDAARHATPEALFRDLNEVGAAEPEQPKRKFRRGATFRGTEEGTDGEA